MQNHTAKHFVLQLGSLVSLYLSLGFLLVILFGVINLAFPAATDTIWDKESARSSIRVGIAILIVFFPTYIILTRTVNRLRRTETEGKYLTLTKWLIYLSLLVGGGVLLGDMVAVVMAFLEGEITERFLLKAGAVLITVGLAFFYYVRDAQGYWMKAERHSIWFGVLMTVIVGATLISGAMYIESPREVREQKLDQQQVQDLMSIQWSIQDYYTINKVLPESLNVFSMPVPQAPEGRAAYQYEVTENGFSLCAEFMTDLTNEQQFGLGRPITEPGMIANPDNWQHGTGTVCFDRVVNTID